MNCNCHRGYGMPVGTHHDDCWLNPRRVSTLPDGIYEAPNRDGTCRPRYVVDGRYGGLREPDGSLTFPTPLPRDTSTWTRVADLPDLRMAEPTQIGYPVMASNEKVGAIACVWLRIYGDDVARPWICTHGNIAKWADLIDPRGLTPDEIAEHNLWTGCV